MKLSQTETQTVILALREYREHWSSSEHKKSFDEVNKLMHRFQRSLKKVPVSFTEN